jgi:hypothetical protein
MRERVHSVAAARPELFALTLSSKYAGASNLRKRDIIGAELEGE